MPISAENLQVMMRIAGLGIICWLVLRSRGKFKATRQIKLGHHLKHNANSSGGSITTFSGTQSIGAPPQVLRWQVELYDLARDLKAELDSKLIAVRELTLRYDAAASRLEELLDSAQKMERQASNPLQHAQYLAQRGWPHTRIADVIGLSLTEVQALLDMPLEATSS